jgi:hypothetical protein
MYIDVECRCGVYTKYMVRVKIYVPSMRVWHGWYNHWSITRCARHMLNQRLADCYATATELDKHAMIRLLRYILVIDNESDGPCMPRYRKLSYPDSMPGLAHYAR